MQLAGRFFPHARVGVMRSMDHGQENAHRLSAHLTEPGGTFTLNPCPTRQRNALQFSLSRIATRISQPLNGRSKTQKTKFAIRRTNHCRIQKGRGA